MSTASAGAGDVRTAQVETEADGCGSSLIVGSVRYLGGLGLLAVGSARAAIWPRTPAPSLVACALRSFDRIIWPGLVLVTLLQASLGAFLAMQAFFSATFRDGSGAVVGLGMLRNLGALVSGWTISAVAPALFIQELWGPREGLDRGDPFSVPDRAVKLGEKMDERVAIEPARLAASRIIACALAAVVLGLWGAVIGIGMGMSVADSLLGVMPGVYAGKLVEMVTPFDLFSLAVKSICFGGLAGLAACYEGLRGEGEGAEAGLPGPMFRAACASMLGIMVLNGSYFTLAYLSGDPGGPAVQQWIR